MAKNYTLNEAVQIINNGSDLEAMAELGKRFPLLTIEITRLLALTEGAFASFVKFIPDHVTANKVNAAMKSGTTSDDGDEDETDGNELDTEVDEGEADEKPAKPSKPAKPAKPAKTSGDKNYADMTSGELLNLLIEHGLRNDCRKKMGGTSKDLMIQYIEKYGLEGGSSDADEKPAKKEDKKPAKPAKKEEEEKATPYDGKSAPDLFKECKSRGIKVEPKKPAKYYIDLLLKDDASKGPESFEDDEIEDDGWDDEPEEKPAKPAGKADKKLIKPAKKETAEDDGDEDWDL